MIVGQIWTGNAYRNFNYLIACPETGEALDAHPLDQEKCLKRAKLPAHINAGPRIDGNDRGLCAKLPDETLVYPGHDYITNNLEYTLDREPGNIEAASLFDLLSADHDPDRAVLTSLAQESEGDS